MEHASRYKPLNVILLSASQALGMSAPSMVVLVGGVAGTQLAPSPALATLPVTLMVIGVALFTIPAALIMRRFGRRGGFVAGSVSAAAAALLAAFALDANSFTLFCVATLLIGSNSAFIQQYRFAAAESVSPANSGRAISIVLLGGVVAGYLGPEIGRRATNWMGFEHFGGPFAVQTLLFLAAIGLLLFFRDVHREQEALEGEIRPLFSLATQPGFLVAILAGLTAYGAMSFIMTATPISMHVIDGFSLDATAFVIQSHVIAMYMPSLVTGLLVSRWGPSKVAATGALGLIVCVLIALFGHHLFNYWFALVLLGVGWNFLFVGGTVLLTQSYLPGERFKAQAINDFTVFGVQALASLSAGSIILRANWELLVLLTLPFLFMVLLGLAWLQYTAQRSAVRQVES